MTTATAPAVEKRKKPWTKARVIDLIIDIFCFVIVGAASLTCILPFIHILAKSLSDNAYVVANRVILLPMSDAGINLDFLSVMGFAYIIAAVMNSYLNVLRGAGDVNVSLVAGLFEMGARLAFASLLAPDLGVWGIWLATPLSWASGCIIPVVRYYSKEWMKRTLI